MEPVYRSVIGLCLTLFRMKQWDIRVVGHEHVPDEGGAVIATNHISYVDFVFVGAAVREATDKRLVRFAAKKEAFDHPVSGPLMRAMRHIPVDRGGGGSKAVEHGTELLRRGELVGMFPEATISRSFVPLPGKTGTARMAIGADAPIVPGAVWGTQRIFPKGRPRDFRRGVTITVGFGAPVHPQPGEHPAELTERLMASIGALVTDAQESYPQRPDPDEGAWWMPAHLGGSAPTPEQALALAREEAAARRRARREASS